MFRTLDNSGPDPKALSDPENRAAYKKNIVLYVTGKFQLFCKAEILNIFVKTRCSSAHGFLLHCYKSTVLF